MKRTKPQDTDFVLYEDWAKPVKPKRKRKKPATPKIKRAAKKGKISASLWKVPSVPTYSPSDTSTFSSSDTYTLRDHKWPESYTVDDSGWEQALRERLAQQRTLWQKAKDLFSKLLLR